MECSQHLKYTLFDDKNLKPCNCTYFKCINIYIHMNCLFLLCVFWTGSAFVRTARGTGGPLIVHHLVWQSDGRAADEGALFVSALQKVGQELPLALDKDGPPPHEAEVVLLQDVVAFLHHLWANKRIVRAYVGTLAQLCRRRSLSERN